MILMIQISILFHRQTMTARKSSQIVVFVSFLEENITNKYGYDHSHTAFSDCTDICLRACSFPIIFLKIGWTFGNWKTLQKLFGTLNDRFTSFYALWKMERKTKIFLIDKLLEKNNFRMEILGGNELKLIIWSRT